MSAAQSSTKQPTVIASLASVVLQEAELRGIDGDALARRAGIEPMSLLEPDARVADAAYRMLWVELERRLRDPAVGIEATERMLSAASLGLLGYVAFNSSTLAEAITRSVRFHALIEESGVAAFEVGARSSAIIRLPPQGTAAFPRVEADHVLASYLFLARRAARAHLVPIEVRFQHCPPPTLTEHVRFFQCPLRFECETNAIVFSNADLESRLQGDPRLGRYLEQLVDARFDGGRATSAFLQGVNAFIVDRLASRSLTIASAAKHLRCSRRTLQRRLAAERVTFQAMIDDARRREARRMFDDGLRTLEIAPQLGFASANAFRRALKRWTGMSAGELERRARFRAAM
jgi:AraC-like DNA-binding protein